MTVRLVRGARWATLVDHLAEQLAASGAGPFTQLRVITSSRGTGRVLSQQVASRLGISAGIAYLSPTDLMRQLAKSAGVHLEHSRWLGTPLDVAVATALSDIKHPLVRHALREDANRPGRRRATALRIARVLRVYFDHCPELLREWAGGSDVSLNGEPLPEELSWQPGLYRSVLTDLELDPNDTLTAICAAAAADETASFVMAVDHLTEPQRSALQSLSEGSGLTILQPGASAATWPSELDATTLELPGESAPVTEVELHDSHGPARQVEVLRDELTRIFTEDPTLEPRDVVIVCPQPQRYGALLDAAFAGADAEAHPGRSLRVQPAGASLPNSVLTFLVSVLRLQSSRATASEITELLLSPPLAHRWQLTDRRAVIELVSGAGIRWGLDAGHRASFGLAEVEQNTWSRGLDRLLIGLAVAPGVDAGLGLSGSEAVTPSDLSLVGALSEVVARLGTLASTMAAPATVSEWVSRSREALDLLVGLPYADQGQLLQALSVLARFESDHRGHPAQFSRHEFAQLVADAAANLGNRVAAGNGSLQVIGLGELQHVEFRVVALIGVSDEVVPGRGGTAPDSIELGTRAPDPQARRLSQLLAHCRAAQRLVIVRESASQRTSRPTALPVGISWLLRQLSARPTSFTHAPMATAESNFLHRPSFDAPSLAGALARRARGNGIESATVKRRVQARLRILPASVLPPAHVTVTQLERYLKDPAQSFLRAAGGIALYTDPTVTDEMPLQSEGLDQWQVINALVDSWKNGTSLSSVENYFRQREDLPPHRIGDALFTHAKESATMLWRRAWNDWSGTRESHAISLQLEVPGTGPVTLTGDVTTRNGFSLAAVPSQGDHHMLRPWLESLALTAQGVATAARLYRFVKHQSAGFTVDAEAAQVSALTQSEALEHLRILISAYVRGQHHLVPAPLQPALTYAREFSSGRFRVADWESPIGHWKSKWPKTSDAWRLFYEEQVSELFADSLAPDDPNNGHATAFQAWAWQLYSPMAKGWS